MIVTITINPAVDKSTSADKLVPEKKIRCASLTTEAGGGGINVSKAIKELGGESLAIYPSGGINGKVLNQILSKSKIKCKIIPVEGETRESFTATELATNAQYRFVMPGSSLTTKEIELCISCIGDLTPFPSIIVASGSLPPGAPDDFFAKLALIVKQKGARFIADTSDKPLQLAAHEGVYLLKPNLSELGTLIGKEYLELSEVEEAAKHIIGKGHCEVVVVSMGPAGAMIVTKEYSERIIAPTVKKLSTVGAGDSMVAGMAWMLEQEKSLAEMVRFGVACGTAATMNQGTKLFKKDDVLRLYEWINNNNQSFKAA